jgi:RNA polymerase sigma-70 factor (ECF subfamily)
MLLSLSAMAAPLTRAFLEGSGGQSAGVNEALLASALAEARAAWPALDIPEAEFMRFLGSRCEGPETLGDLSVPDLYLAFGCALGVPAAVNAFVGRYLAAVPQFIAHIDAGGWLAEEVRQELAEKLLVAQPPAPPRIASYGGRGPLESWVAVSAQRTALTVLRRRDPGAARSGGDSLEQLLSGGMDPELALAKAEVKRDFEEALRAALRAQSPRDRMLLRLNLVSGLSCQKIGKIYGVNASTIARWIAVARDKMLAEVQRHLKQTRNLEPHHLQSLLGLARSQIDLSLSGVLRPEPDSTDS